MIALIPARLGSKRLPNKNWRRLAGRQLIEYTIKAARDSGVFSDVIVATDAPIGAFDFDDDSELLLNLFYRPSVTDDQPDFLWVRDVLSAQAVRPVDFAILRPTSPFRSCFTIQRAYFQWHREKDCIDSLRAVRPVTETPYKMWISAGPKGYERGYPMVPVLPGAHADGTPYHSSPTQTLPSVYVQTGALEMGWTRNVEQLGSISGRKVAPFFCEGPESIDLNTERDWAEAERLIASGEAVLPQVGVAGLPRAPQTV